jgi:predicted RND superfamily exporter protein
MYIINKYQNISFFGKLLIEIDLNLTKWLDERSLEKKTLNKNKTENRQNRLSKKNNLLLKKKKNFTPKLCDTRSKFNWMKK